MRTLPRIVSVLLAVTLSLTLPLAVADVRTKIAEIEKQANNDAKGALDALAAMAQDAITHGRTDDLKRIEKSRCWLLSYTDPTAAVQLANTLFGNASLANDPMLHTCRGYAYEQLNRPEEALAEYEYGVRRATAVSDENALARAMALRGEQRYHRGMYADAISDLKSSYDLERRLGNMGNQRYVLNALANLYADSNVKDYDSALEVYEKLLKQSEETGNLRAQATAHFNLASTLENQGKLAPASVHFKKALDAESRRAESPAALAADIANDKRAYAVVLSKLGEHQQALALFNAAEVALRARPDRQALASLYLSRGAAHRRAGRNLQALIDLNAALSHFGETGNHRFLVKIHEERAASYAQAGEWRNAYLAQAEMAKAQQAVNKQMLDERTTRLRVQFQSEQTRLRNAELQHQNALQQRDLANTARIRRWQLAALAASFALIFVLATLALKHRRQSRRMRDIAMTDELTRLPNRRHFMASANEAFASAVENGAALSIAAIDIDHFKRVNDQHGHAAGDLVLQRVAFALRMALRPGDIVGRTGGEEFLCLVRGASESEAMRAAERLRQAVLDIERSDLPAGLTPSISVGVAGRLETDHTLDLLCQRADAALYRAKENGRNRVELAAA